jgi:drug/metabolite transporter (DMT)-like permease
MAGVALAMAPGAALPDAALLPWALLMLLTPVCYALSNLFSIGLAVKGAPVLAQASGTVILAAIGAVLIALPLGHLGLPPSLSVLGILLAQGVLTGAAYLLYFRLLTGPGGVFASQIAYVITLAGLIWGFVLFGEVPGWLTIPAALLIFAGVALVSTEQRARLTPADASSRSRRS